jgi:Carboxypeptidase regulatory-like domain
MSRFLLRLQALAIATVLLQSAAISHADTCVGYVKRAPVKAVCGRVIDLTGAKLKNVELTLPGEDGSVLFSTRSDDAGKFSFSSIPTGDYTLHVKAEGYHEPERQIHVISSKHGACRHRIEIELGLKVCDTSIYVKGVDKPSDLEAEWKKWQN